MPEAVFAIEAIEKYIEMRLAAHASECDDPTWPVPHDVQVMRDAKDAVLALALQLEAMKREMAEKDERIAALEKGLKHFADEAAGWSDAYPDSCLARTSKSNLGDLRRARTLIQGEKK